MSARLLGKAGYSLGLTIWVVFSLVVGQSLASLIVFSLPEGGNESVLTTILAALGYAFGLALALGVPALATRKPVPRRTIGFHRLPDMKDIGLGILSVLPYFVVSGIILWFGMEIIKVISPDVGQQVPFENLTSRIEYMVAFATLVIIAPFAEEILFRGYFLGSLSEKIGNWVAVLVTAVVFGSMHLLGFTDSGIVLQWGAAADTFAMGLIAGSLRTFTGSIWAGVVLHAIKNGIAFYFLFIA